MVSRRVAGALISGIVCAVPSHVKANNEFVSMFDEESAIKFGQKTGIYRRHVTTSSTCTSDLCFSAAVRLLDQLGLSRDAVDVLIFVSQTPDYVLPATACLLQQRLGLPTSVAAFDVNLGCSGYVYGLWLASSLVSSGQAKNVLLLVGDTCTKFVSDTDKSTAPIFGDAGSASLITAEVGFESYFHLGTNGQGAKNLMIHSGGFRNPSDGSSRQKVDYLDGTSRSVQDLYMNGGEIFNFTIGTVGSAIQEFLKEHPSQVDAFVFHQANRLMLDHLRKKLAIPAEKLWLSLDEFGNTSSASIPLTIVYYFNQHAFSSSQNLLLAGFGVGYSWALSRIQLRDGFKWDLVEV